MTLPPKLEKLIDNWPAKVIAFATALFLYAYYQISSLDTRTLTVPLEIRGITSMEPVGHVNRYVRISLRGDSADINHLSRDDFKAYIDVSREDTSGTVRSRVYIDLSEQATAMNVLSVDVTPAEVTLELEKRIARYVPVEPVLVGEVPYGYEVTSVTCEPPQVRIYGAEKLINSVETLATDGIFLDYRTTGFSEKKSPYSPNSGISWDSTDSVNVTVAITPQMTEKTFSNVPLAILNTRSDLEYEIQTTRRGEIVLNGSVLSFERYSSSPVGLFIDGSSLTKDGTYTVPVVAGVSQQFGVSLFSPKEVVVLVREKEPEPVVEAESTGDTAEGAD